MKIPPSATNQTQAPAGGESLARDDGCFHCGLPLNDQRVYPITFRLEQKPTCCPGCQAAAGAIINAGLDTYYDQRTVMPVTLTATSRRPLAQLEMFDLPEVQTGFVRPLGEDEREAALIIEGITCPACVWLIERHLSVLSGIVSVEINYASQRAHVRWDQRRMRLSEILRAVSVIGYSAHPYNPDKQASVRDVQRKTLLWQLFVAGFAMMQVMMYAWPVYLAGEDEMAPDIVQLMRWASLVLTTPVVFFSAAPFFRNAWRDLRFRRLGMDVPIALAIAVAYGASCWATLTAQGEVYFDSVAMFVFFLLGGRYLEHIARAKAAESAERLVQAQPAVARLIDRYPSSASEKIVAACALRKGDVARVLPGDTVPADGVVIEGMSSVDEALLTGESRPVDKKQGDALTGGAINQSGPLIMRVTQAGTASRLAAIERLLERALAQRPAIAMEAEKVASWFVGLILLTAALTFTVWMAIDGQRALWVAVSVLAVTCPCALSLATPVALTAATQRLAKTGMLAVRADAIENLARVTHVIFDKTGTLTSGMPSLDKTLPLSFLTVSRCLDIACVLEQASEHPLAKSFLDAARQAGVKIFPHAEGLKNIPGGGVEGIINDKCYRLGSLSHVAQICTQPIPPQLSGLIRDSAASVVVMGDESRYLAAFLLSDKLRPKARMAVSRLQRMGKQVWLVSGDSLGPVAQAAHQLGIEHYYDAQTPAQKLAVVKRLQQAGAVVAMVGDGVNDAPVLGQAQVSIAMGGASDLAHSAADMVLLNGDLTVVAEADVVARKTLVVIKQNIAWALAYNVVALPLAVAGYVTPWMAGLGMSLSSLVVVWNALRLGRVTPVDQMETREPMPTALRAGME